MYHGTFTSDQSVEVVVNDSHLPVFEITVRCTSRGTDARLSGPPEDCYPTEGPEFELESIAINVDGGKSLDVSPAL